MKTYKNIIVHDHFQIDGGAERYLYFVAKELKYEIFTFFKQKKFSNSKILKGFLNLSIDLHPIARAFLCFVFYFFYSFDFKNYKKIILSGHFSLLLLRPNIEAKIIYLCHSPPRFLTDQKKEYKKKYKFFYYLFFLNSFIDLYASLYKKKLNYCDKIICNSFISKKRLSKFINKKKIEVLHPISFDVSKFKYKKSENFYLSISRLHWAKRVLDVVKVFSEKELKKHKLVICSDGPERNKIINIIKEKKLENITYYGEISNKKKIDLLSRCKAVIHIPINEEFGFVNLETLASGKTLISTNEGEFSKILKKNKDNILIKKYNLNKLKRTIINFNKKKSFSKLNHNIKISKKFSKKRFLKKIKFLIDN